MRVYGPKKLVWIIPIASRRIHAKYIIVKWVLCSVESKFMREIPVNMQVNITRTRES